MTPTDDTDRIGIASPPDHPVFSVVAAETGVDLGGVRLDSGDLAALSKQVDEILPGTDQFISSGIDEYAIRDRARRERRKLPEAVRRIEDPAPYEVRTSDALEELTRALRVRLESEVS